MEERQDVQGKDGVQPHEVTVRWYVVFEGDVQPERVRWWHFWRWITPPAFRHCWAFGEIGDDFVSVLPEMGGTRVMFTSREALKEEGFDHMWQWAVARGEIVIPATHVMQDRFAMRWSPFTCVTLIKSLLGLRFCGALTPYRLYCYLVKHCLDMVKYGEILDYKRQRGIP